MTTQQIQLVQRSWEKVKPAMQQAGELFYFKLFKKAPQIRHLFKEDITEQAGKLGYMLTYVVSRLDKLETILDDVQRLAVNHNKYGAQPAHYAVVGECLLETLEEGLKPQWNEELKQAWTVAYGILSNAMIEAQQNAMEKRA